MNRYYPYVGQVEDTREWYVVSDGYIIVYEPAVTILWLWGFGKKVSDRFKLSKDTKILQEETGTDKDRKGWIKLANPNTSESGRYFFASKRADLFIEEIKRELSRYR